MSRFGNNNPVTFREKNLMSKKTKHATNFSMNLLNDFLQERSVNTDILSYSKEDLSRVLEDFYSNVRMKNGELYKKNSLLNIRQGIGRYLKEKGSNIDIITDPHFAKANSCFSSLLRMTRAEGKGAVVHHPALTVEDLKKLYGHHFIFNTNTPQGLLNKVVFEIMFYFCRRGQENLHNLRVQDFEIINSNEQKYVQKVTSELSKNHQGITNEIEGTGGRMYATNSELCPVQSFEKYLSKRHAGTDRLFLHSKNIFSDDEAVWYRNEPLGVNTMKKFMKNVSKSAGLSREYTNHCIRSTTITLLNHCGFESRHIATVSGHRNESSLSSYCYDTSGTVDLLTSWDSNTSNHFG